MRPSFIKTSSICLAVLAGGTFASTALSAVWEPFTIRTVGGAVTPVTPVGTADGTAFTVVIDESGEKAGYGTGFFDGQTLANVGNVSYTRVDPGAPDPYVNIWITDGTRSAVIAPMANMTTGGNYTSNDVNGLDLQSRGFNIYETDFSDLSWLGVTGGTRTAQAFTHADGAPVLVSEIGHLLVNDPGTYGSTVGTGAPKNGTGFNLVFGDTQGNFNNPVPYTLANVTVGAVPEPATLGVVALALGSMMVRRKRRAA